jgi:hypothetical protein
MKFISFSPVQFAIFTVYFIAAIDMFGTSLVVPVLAMYTQYLGASKSDLGLNFSSVINIYLYFYFVLGILYTIFSGCRYYSQIYTIRQSL